MTKKTMIANIIVPTMFGQGNNGPSDPAAPRHNIIRPHIKKFFKVREMLIITTDTDFFDPQIVIALLGVENISAI
jgi:hypothetical protein